MADVTPEQAHWAPPGCAHPIAALYAHTVLGEDGMLNRLIRKGTPLYTSNWAGKTGLSELPPERSAWSDWARRLRVDLPTLLDYAQAVYATTDAYLASLTPTDLDTEIEMFGQKRTLGSALGGVLLAHVNSHTGEVSCLKGLQGARGYPF